MHFWNVFQLICFGGQYIPVSKKDINELGLSCDKKFQNFNSLIQFSPNLKGRFVSLALVRKKNHLWCKHFSLIKKTLFTDKIHIIETVPSFNPLRVLIQDTDKFQIFFMNSSLNRFQPHIKTIKSTEQSSYAFIGSWSCRKYNIKFGTSRFYKVTQSGISPQQK